MLALITLFHDAVAVALGAVDLRGPPNAPLATRRPVLAIDFHGCGKGLESDRAAGLAMGPRSTTRWERPLVAVTLLLNDPDQRECMTMRRRPTCFHGKNRPAGCTYPTCRQRARRPAAVGAADAEMISLRAQAVAAEPRWTLATRCTQFRGGRTRLGPRLRRVDCTKTRGLGMATAQFEGPQRGLGPSTMRRGQGPSLAWRRETHAS